MLRSDDCLGGRILWYMLFDSHCHIPDEKYNMTIEQLIEDSRRAGVTHLIAIGTSLENSSKTVSSIMECKNVYASIGIYPDEDLHLSFDAIYKGLTELHKKHSSKIIAVGECGIDLSGNHGGRDLHSQKELFKLQLGFAVEYDLPVIIHNRNADTEIIEILEKYKMTGLRGVIHCFTSDWAFASRVLDLGFYVSFSGIITYPSATDNLLEVVRKVPQDKYLIETDAPYLPPQGYRGQPNYPKYVRITAEKAALIRNVSFDEVSSETFRNTCKLFGIKNEKL